MATEENYQAAYEAFALFVEEYTTVMKSILEAEVYNALVSALTGATREQILAFASANAGAMVTNITESTASGIAEIIATALEKQVGVDGAAKMLQEMAGLNKQQVQQVEKLKEELLAKGLSQEEIDKQIEAFTSEKIKERAEMIAQTEMRRAVQEGEYEVMKDRGARYKVWISSGDEIVSDECQENEAAGVIDIDEDFPSGVNLPPSHPNCRCTVSFITSDEQADRANDRADQRAEKTANAKSQD